MPHHTWAYASHSKCSLPIQACGNSIQGFNGFAALRCALSCCTPSAGKATADSGVRLSRSHDSHANAAHGDLALTNSAAGQANGRVYNRAAAFTVAPAVNTEWVCPPNQQRYHELSHIVPLHGRQNDGHLHPSHSSNTDQDPEAVPGGRREAHTPQAWPLQVPTKTHQPYEPEQQDQQQPSSVQNADTAADVLEGLVSSLGSDTAQPNQVPQVRVQQQQQQQQLLQLQRQHEPLLQQQKQKQERKQQQEQLQPRARHKGRLDRCHPRQHAHSAAERVSNNTSADGMAYYLLSKIQQQLKKTRHRKQQPGVLHQQNMAGPADPVDGPGHLQLAITSQQTVTLQCCSSKSLHTALQAIGLAAQQAARLCPAQQLLLQPQMVRNAVGTAADGRHGAGAYQLQVLWVPAAAAAVGSQVQQQQRPHTAARQQQKPRQGHQCSEQQHTHCRLAPKAQGAVLQAADAATAGIAGVRQLQPLVCDSPAARTQQQATSKHSGHTSRTAQSSTPHSRLSVQSVSWHVSGLLRGNWPAQLQCSCPAGALTAVKALVRARKQLAASGMDMLAAVTLSGQDRAPGTGEAAVAEHTAFSGPQVVLWAVGYAVRQAEDGSQGAAPAGRLSSSCDASQVEFVRVPAAEQYLRQQQRERRKHKQMLTGLQQQHSVPTASRAVPHQQHQQPHHHITCVQQHPLYVVGAHGLEALSLIAAPHTMNSNEQHHHDEQQLLQLLPVGASCSPVPAPHHAAKEQQQEQMRLLSLQGLSKPQGGHQQPLHAATTAGGVAAARSNYERQPAKPQQPLQPQSSQDLCCRQPIMLLV